MQKSPVTDKTLGVILTSDYKFSEVRQKAKDEYIERAKKKKKDKKTKLPKFNIDDEVVTSSGGHGSNKKYYLIKVVDFRESYHEFEYFGICIRTTDKSYKRIGRLEQFNDSHYGYFGRFKNENVPVNSIKWLEEK